MAEKLASVPPPPKRKRTRSRARRADPVITLRLRESAARRLIAGLHRGRADTRDEIRRMLAGKVDRRWLATEERRVREAIHGRKPRP